MPFSHHSHSGQFCHHAKDTLEEMIQTAISKGMRVIALTEHMPRDRIEDLYPEEVNLHFLNSIDLLCPILKQETGGGGGGSGVLTNSNR